MVGEHPDRLQLGVLEQVRLVDHQDGCSAPLGLLDGQRAGGLRDQGGVMDQGLPAQRGDDLVVDAADPDGGVGEVDDGVPGRVQPGQRGADRDGLPGADLAGDDPDPALADAPADAGHGFAVAGVAVQHPRRQIAAEGGAAEPEEALQPVDHADTPSRVRPRVLADGAAVGAPSAAPSAGAPVSRSSCPGSWSVRAA